MVFDFFKTFICTLFSIILACSHFGGLSGGSDIDYNIVYGRGMLKNELSLSALDNCRYFNIFSLSTYYIGMRD